MLTSLVVLLAVVVALLTVLVVGLLRSYGEVLRRMHEAGLGSDATDVASAGSALGATPSGAAAIPSGTSSVDLPPGADEATDIARRLDPSVPAPRPGVPPLPEVVDVAGVTPHGDAVAVGVRGSGRLTLLAFLSSGCGTCAGFWAALRTGRGVQVDGRDVTPVVVTGGPANEVSAAVARLAGDGLTVVMSDEAWRHYAVPATPYFVLVDAASGIVGEGSAMTWDQLVGLLGRAVEDRGGDLTIDLRSPTPDGTGPAVPAGMRGGRAREDRADAALLAAGIRPGDAALHTSPLDAPGS